MNWYTICGYDGAEGQNIVVNVQANSEEQANVKFLESFPGSEVEYLFFGKQDELTGNPERFEIYD